jgi:hypothetical protein
MRYSCNRRGREDASADIWSQDGIATETTARCQLGKTCVCGSWIEPKRNRQILACIGLVQLKWPAAGILARFLPPSCTLRIITKHKENTQKFGSCPLRSKTLVFPGFFAYLANCFGFPARPCTCMLAHAASSSALPCPLVSRPVSRQSRLRTLVFPGKTGGFAAEGVGFELVGFES